MSLAIGSLFAVNHPVQSIAKGQNMKRSLFAACLCWALSALPSMASARLANIHVFLAARAEARIV